MSMSMEAQVALAEKVARDAADRSLYFALRLVQAHQEVKAARGACENALRDLKQAQALRDAMRDDLESHRLVEALKTPPPAPVEPEMDGKVV